MEAGAVLTTVDGVQLSDSVETATEVTVAPPLVTVTVLTPPGTVTVLTLPELVSVTLEAKPCQ